jgi:hypothetical protein
MVAVCLLYSCHIIACSHLGGSKKKRGRGAYQNNMQQRFCNSRKSTSSQHKSRLRENERKPKFKRSMVCCQIKHLYAAFCRQRIMPEEVQKQRHQMIQCAIVSLQARPGQQNHKVHLGQIKWKPLIPHTDKTSGSSDLIDMITCVNLNPLFEFVMGGLIAMTPSKHMVLSDVSTDYHIHTLSCMHCVEPEKRMTFHECILTEESEQALERWQWIDFLTCEEWGSHIDDSKRKKYLSTEDVR